MLRQKSNSISLVIASFIFASFLTSSASAFDGHRKGFVMGFGLGLTPIGHWSVRDLEESGKEFGRAGIVLLGYAWSDANILVFAGDYSSYGSDDRNQYIRHTSLEGVTWYHYWGKHESRWFSRLGIGWYYNDSRYTNVGGDGLGILFGGGYEIFKQVQLGLNYFGGKGTESGSYSATAYSLTLSATIIAY